MRIIISTAMLLGLCLGTAAAQTVSGRVIDGETNTRIPAAEVMIVQVDSSARTLTDTAGGFRVRAKPGLWTLRVQALGYEDLVTQPMRVESREHLSVVVVMSAKPLDIAPITVIGRSNRALSRLEEFQARMKRNAFGYFMDQKAIERVPVHFVSDVLRRVPGLWVSRDRVMMRDCQDANYLIDGMPVLPVSGETSTQAVNSMLSPTDIAGIEVYRGDGVVPPQLMAFLSMTQSPGACGLVAIWTKR